MFTCILYANAPLKFFWLLQAIPANEFLEHWKLPANTGRQFGALTGDRNPIHLYPFTSQLFGFKRPICHALYQVGRLEGTLVNAGKLRR
jgi:acyl dehydratase